MEHVDEENERPAMLVAAPVLVSGSICTSTYPL